MGVLYTCPECDRVTNDEEGLLKCPYCFGGYTPATEVKPKRVFAYSPRIPTPSQVDFMKQMEKVVIARIEDLSKAINTNTSLRYDRWLRELLSFNLELKKELSNELGLFR